jgi:hypothetical protein
MFQLSKRSVDLQSFEDLTMRVTPSVLRTQASMTVEVAALLISEEGVCAMAVVAKKTVTERAVRMKARMGAPGNSGPKLRRLSKNEEIVKERLRIVSVSFVFPR